jgi:energy-coupling factor transporter ATP-binding protein EcfA2
MRSISSIEQFGAIDADNDDLLSSCFEDHEAYLDLNMQKKFLILGRKGSGKTAIFKRMLTIHQQDTFCFGHTFSDYPWHHHDLQARIGIPNFDKFTHSWKYLILMTASKIILNYDQSLPIDSKSMDYMMRIEQFILDSYGTRDPDVTQIFTPTRYLRIKPNFQIDLKILKAGISPEQVPMPELPKIVQELNANLIEYIIDCLNPANKYYVLFDQLDLGFDPTSPDYCNRLIGLLLACRDLNLAAKNKNKKFFAAIFLRDDIYDMLQFEDKNKITENYVSLIEWDTPRTNKSLKQLMEKRFNVLLREQEEQITWNDVFDESKEMPGHQTKFQHILDRTYLRPRDVIKFCNSILKQYKTRIQRHSGPEKIQNTDIHNARVEYSIYLNNELDDEIHKHLPNYKDYLEVLRKLGSWQFIIGDFEREYKASLFQLEKSILDALHELYAFSVVGFYRPGGRGFGGSEYVFKYKEPQTRFDSLAARFRVHPGLIEVLGLKRI